MTLLSFLGVTILAVLRKRHSAIWLPLLFYIVSSLPFYILVYEEPEWFFFGNHLLQNNLIILLAYFVGFIFSSRVTAVYIAPILVSFTKKRVSLKLFLIICFIVIAAEIFGILMFHKPNFIFSLVNQSALVDRVYFEGYPFPFNLYYTNYYGFLLLFTTFLFALMISEYRSFPVVVLFLLFSIIYLSMLKKSAILMLAAALGLYLYQSGLYRKRKYFLGGVFLFLTSLIVLWLVSMSYYKDGNIWTSLANRLFFEAIPLTADFHRIFGNLSPSLNLLPSEGSKLFGFEGRHLEKEIFFEVHSNRVNRYGNAPILSYTYGTIALGWMVNFYLLFVYSLYFGAAIYLSRKLRTNDIRSIAFHVTIAVCSMPLFLSGAFKNFSIFILYPISLLMLFLGYKLLPKLNRTTKYVRT